ncbi:MAG TPA: methyltransferase [Nitrospiraceae bacterium]|nr:methyltransferase [Nitrospiraceae bacterium]
MRITPLRSFEEFRDLVAAYRLPRIVLTALELDLFTVIGEQSWAVPALAKKLRVSARGLDILCRNLASAGILIKNGDRYRNGKVAASTLNARSLNYRGGYIHLIRDQWNDWGKLTASVRFGRPLEHNDDPDDSKYRKQFTWAMHHRSIDVAPQVAAGIDLSNVQTLLDLGGGPGTYALEFLKRNSTLCATVADRAPALEVAKEIAAKLRHGRRLSYLPLDFTAQAITGRYDVIWFSNVLHIYSPEENRRLFRNMADALEPNGRLLIQDAFLLDKNGLYPQEANLFAVTMLLFTEGGNTYSVDDTAAWLREAGFRKVRRVTLPTGTGDWEGGVLEATDVRPHQGSRVRRSRSTENSAGR